MILSLIFLFSHAILTTAETPVNQGLSGFSNRVFVTFHTLKKTTGEKYYEKSKVLFLAQAAMIAAIYVVLTVLGASLAFGEVQIRFAEALTILPVFTPAAIPGLFIGCLLGNILGGAILPDIIFGSIATLIGAVFTRMLRNKSKYLAPLPPVVANTIIVPFVLKYAYAVPLPIPFMMLTVGVGEVISAGVIGLILYEALYKYKTVLFKSIA